MNPMLAATIDDLSKLRYPLYASPKLDGIRALVIDDKLVSRKLKPIPNCHVRLSLSLRSFSGFDGELICGPPHADDVYRKTMSAVMTELESPAVTFWVFDNRNSSGQYHERYSTLPRRMDAAANVIIRRLPYLLVHDEASLTSYEEEMLRQGYEGVMLRDPRGLYKHGRSTVREGGLLKLKRFWDSEAKILEVIEEQRNDNQQTTSALGTAKRSSHKANKIPKGTVGALLVRDLISGVEFRIGTGLDDATAQEFWANPPIGQIIKYKYQPVGVKDKPRFPVFLGLRKD